MGGDDEKENLIAELNTAFESHWACSVGITFWEKGNFSGIEKCSEIRRKSMKSETN